MGAEQQLQAAGEQGPHVSLGAAAVTAVHSGQRPGQAPVRRLALLLPVSASGPEFASAQDDHLLRSPGSALLKSTPRSAKRKAMAPVLPSPVAMAVAQPLCRRHSSDQCRDSHPHFYNPLSSEMS